MWFLQYNLYQQYVYVAVYTSGYSCVDVPFVPGWWAPCLFFCDRLPTSVFGFCVYLAVRINCSSSVEQTVTRSNSLLHTVSRSQLRNRILVTRSVSWENLHNLKFVWLQRKKKYVASCTDDVDTPVSFGNRLKDFNGIFLILPQYNKHLS